MGRIRFITLGVVAVVAMACSSPGVTGGPTATVVPAGSQSATAEPTLDA